MPSERTLGPLEVSEQAQQQLESHSDLDGTYLNGTIECLLKLRSVRDQFADAGLDLSCGKLSEELATLEHDLVDHLAAQREHRDGVGLLTVAVVGDFNSGKSTFINALLENDLCPIGEEPTTSSVTHFIHGDKERIEQLSDRKRKRIKKSKYRSLVRHDKIGDREPDIFHISVNAPILEHIRLVDTPGFNAPPPNSHDTKVTENAITKADALFVLMDIRKGNPTKSLLEQLDRLWQSKEDDYRPPMFLLLNKAEELPPTQRKEVKSECKTRYGDLFRDVTLISALQLNDSDDAAPLDALQTATQQIRDALLCRDSFKALISAKVVAETGTAIYRMDINGNIYEVLASSDSSLASREHLYEMVRSVSAERHSLLERQFHRKISQLREDWQKTLSNLDYELKLALKGYTGVNGGTDDTKSKALEAIDNTKDHIIGVFSDLCKEVFDEMITKSQRKEEGIFFDDTIYQINVHLNKAQKISKDHGDWDRISNIYNNLLSFLKRLTGISIEPYQNKFVNEFVKKIKKEVLRFISDLTEEIKKEFRQDKDWKYKRKGDCWRLESIDDEYLADEKGDFVREAVYIEMASNLQEQRNECILLITPVIQKQIDNLREAIISGAEQSRSHVQERAEELDRLQQRINELKEYAP